MNHQECSAKRNRETNAQGAVARARIPRGDVHCGEGACSGTYRTWPQIDPVLLLAVLEPTTALFLPDGGLVELVEMCVYIVERVLRHGDGADVVVLDLLHHLDRVFDSRLYGGEQRS